MRPWRVRTLTLALLAGVAGCPTPVPPGTSDGGSSASAPGTVQGLVREVGSAQGLAGVTVRLPDPALPSMGRFAVTDAQGRFAIHGVAQTVRAAVVVEHPGYAMAIEPVEVESGAASEAEVTLVRYTATATFNASQGGRVDDGAGGVVVVPPGSLRTPDDRPATGMVTVSIAPLDPSIPAQMDAFPGDFSAARSDRTEVELETFVPMVVEARQGTQPLQLAPGMSAELTLPVPPSAAGRAPEQIEFWSLDPTTGRWREEGMAQRVPDPRAPSRVSYRAPVRRMGWWNADRPTQTTCVRGCVRSAEGAAFPRATVLATGVDYLGRSATTTRPDTGCFALDVKLGATVSLVLSSGTRRSAPRTVATPRVAMRARNGAQRCEDLGTLTFDAPMPPTCEAGFALCGARCVDTRVDANHCGACGRACEEGIRCISGTCGGPDAGMDASPLADSGPRCEPGFALCGINCVDVRANDAHCGRCERACVEGARCVAGACVVPDAGTDVAVPPDVRPDTGGPRCDPGAVLCGTNCVSLESNDLHCGGCNRACEGGSRCVAGACVVPDGGTCGAGLSLCAGRCVSLLTNGGHCGACDRACPVGWRCAAGACALSCGENSLDCDGNTANGCETNSLTVTNCRECGRVCTAPAGATATCTYSGCGFTCPPGRTACAGACVDLQTDGAHCGACDRPCPAGQACAGAVCVAPPSARPYRIVALPAVGCARRDVTSVSGSNAGALAYGSEALLHTGALATTRHEFSSLMGDRLPTRYAAMVTVGNNAYVLADGGSPLGSAGGRVTSLRVVDPSSGALLTTGVVTLSTPVDVRPGAGFFAGDSRAVIFDGARVHDIEVPSGRVTDRGALTFPAHQTCAGSLGFWGTAEFFLGELHLDFIQSRTAIARVRVSDGSVSALATFTDLGTSCSFTVGPGRWMLASEGPSQFTEGTPPGNTTLVSCPGFDIDRPIVVSGSRLAVGSGYTCAVRDNGSVACWGENRSGQLGLGTVDATIHALPATVPGLSRVVSISARADHTCALVSSGQVYCWGSNGLGQLGIGTTLDRPVATAVTGLADAVEVAVGYNHGCARRADGTVVCWGSNSAGQLGDGGTRNRTTPSGVLGLANAAQLSLGNAHSCARTLDGRVVCWGSNVFGQLGDGSATNRSSPTPVPGLAEVQSLALGESHGCAASRGATWCWGLNNYGQLGDGTTLRRPMPVAIDGASAALQLAANGAQSCAIRSGGQAWCWGLNTAGQLGDGTLTTRLLPVMVSSASGTAEVGVGLVHGCARSSAGVVSCWGGNTRGQLGDGTSISRPTPVTVRGL